MQTVCAFGPEFEASWVSRGVATSMAQHLAVLLICPPSCACLPQCPDCIVASTQVDSVPPDHCRGARSRSKPMHRMRLHHRPQMLLLLLHRPYQTTCTIIRLTAVHFSLRLNSLDMGSTHNTPNPQQKTMQQLLQLLPQKRSFEATVASTQPRLLLPMAHYSCQAHHQRMHNQGRHIDTAGALCSQ